MYYIRPLLYDSVTVTLQFSHGISMKCIGYYNKTCRQTGQLAWDALFLSEAF